MIRYIFKFDSGVTKIFEIDLDARTLAPDPIPEWMLLDTNKCPNCPLNASEKKICPAALEVRPIIAAFENTLSTEKALVKVETPERSYEKYVDAQTGIMALIGLLMARSDCPLLIGLRGLAKFHLPFASAEETLFRSVAAHFLKQYFKYKNGSDKTFDLNELSRFYENLSLLNYHFIQRIRLASKKDANLNALIVLHTLGTVVEMSIEEQLLILEEQFTN